MIEYPQNAIATLEGLLETNEFSLGTAEHIRRVLEYCDQVRATQTDKDEFDRLQNAYLIAAQKLAAIKIMVDSLNRKD